jgi:hypothetical protein
VEQLRVILGHLRKQHFWLLCVLCIAAGVAAWWMAAGSLSKDYASRKSAIEGKFNEVSGILNEPNFPNAEWQKAVDDLTAQQKDKVRTAWQRIYDEQAPHLKWPEQLTAFQAIRSQSQAEQLDRFACERYMTVVPEEFPKLLDIIGAQSVDKKDAVPGVTAPAIDTAGKVAWDSSNQDAIKKTLTFEGRPSPLQVWIAQENLWVYRVLLNVFKNVNEGRYLPAVKEIKRIVIAQDAAKEFEKGLASGIIAKPASASPDSGGGGGGGMDMPGGPPGDIGGEGAPPPDQGRYLDAEGKPLASGSGQQSPFRRMPVFMELIVDEREIPKLLVECANSPLPVEVNQLRVNPTKGTESKSPIPGQDGAPGTRSSYDVPVEICGIIYIYNPPDTAKLGTGADPAAGAQAGVPGQ